MKLRIFVSAVFVCIALSCGGLGYGQGRGMTFEDVMRFRAIHDPVISADGTWIAFEARPDRGDGETVVQNIVNQARFAIERGRKPAFSKDSRWLTVRIEPSWEETENASGKKDKKTPRPGAALLNLDTGEKLHWDSVEESGFSDDSHWFAYLQSEEESQPETKDEGKQEEKKSENKEDSGATLVIRNLGQALEVRNSHVKEFLFSPEKNLIVFSVAAPEGVGNGLFYRSLSETVGEESAIYQADKARLGSLTWNEEGTQLAFLSEAGDKESKKSARLGLWNAKDLREPLQDSDIPEGWKIPLKNGLKWSKDGKRLFLGFKPVDEGVQPDSKAEEETEGEPDPYDIVTILKGRGVDVWHWNDDLISPQQKKMWKTVQERTYQAVHHLDSGRTVLLADRSLPQVQVTDNPDCAYGWSDVRYLKETTWGEDYRDLYVVDLDTGKRTLVVERNEAGGRNSVDLSPLGGYLVFYNEGHWHLFDRIEGKISNLTANLPVPFANEDDDYPASDPGYGVADWLEDDSAVLIYDKYDIWEFPTGPGEPLNLTGAKGRSEATEFRIVKTDPEKKALVKGQRILLRGYHDLEKNSGFFSAVEGEPGVSLLLEEEKNFQFVKKAEEADVFVYTRESYSEFPDLWVADGEFSEVRKVTDVNPQISEFTWGSAELVQWKSWDGYPLQGVLIKPGNYQEGKKYPLLVYFYRFFSQRLHEFNQPVVNHRPCFPFYSSNGYAIFLPDIRFEIGRPGLSSAKSLIPGVQALVDMGIADPHALALHGHSWSGYQTAFIITQTDLFTAAIAGAPVSNMTSAYGGIRWGSGRARQFQYEVSQSRIGGSLWDDLPAYLENSPLFFADRINTPLLIEFGDEDDAVPWYQGIELYLAMRRLGKDCVFLQYRGEPHHPQKYPNKLDYAIKMKEYLDHYLKGVPAPEWISRGVPYAGK